MLRSTTAMRSRSQFSVYCSMTWSILAWFAWQRRAGLRSRGPRGAHDYRVVPDPVDPFGHRERRLGGLLTPVPHLPTRPRPGLLLAQRRHHAEGRGHASGEGHLADSRRRLAGDVLEVGRLAADD